jgi:hypothetical protein
LPKNKNSIIKKYSSSADVLTTVSEGLAEKLRPYNPAVAVLRNSIENHFQLPDPARSNHFTITYTGSMFLDTRNARPLFEAVKNLASMTILSWKTFALSMRVRIVIPGINWLKNIL